MTFSMGFCSSSCSWCGHQNLYRRSPQDISGSDSCLWQCQGAVTVPGVVTWNLVQAAEGWVGTRSPHWGRRAAGVDGCTDNNNNRVISRAFTEHVLCTRHCSKPFLCIVTYKYYYCPHFLEGDWGTDRVTSWGYTTRRCKSCGLWTPRACDPRH